MMARDHLPLKIALGYASAAEAIACRSVCKSWKSAVESAELWQRLSGSQQICSLSDYRVLFQENLLLNGDLAERENIQGVGVFPLGWNGELTLEVEPRIEGMAANKMRCPADMQDEGRKTICIMAPRGGFFDMEFTAYLNDQLLVGRDGDLTRDAERSLRRVGMDVFDEWDAGVPPALLQTAGLPLLLRVWVAGREDWRSAFSMSLSLMGAKARTGKYRGEHQAIELGRCSTKNSWSTPGSWRPVHLLIPRCPAGVSAVMVTLTSIGAGHCRAAWRVDNMPYEHPPGARRSSLFPDMVEDPVGAKLAHVQLRFVPHNELQRLQDELAAADSSSVPVDSEGLEGVLSDVLPAAELNRGDRQRMEESEDEEGHGSGSSYDLPPGMVKLDDLGRPIREDEEDEDEG